MTRKKRVEAALAARREKALADRDRELVALAKVDAALVELHYARVEVGRALKEALEIMSPRILTPETGLKPAERRRLVTLAEELSKDAAGETGSVYQDDCDEEGVSHENRAEDVTSEPVSVGIQM
ncbi:hypothetical protein [Corynebacterium mastitidis]